MTKQKYLKKLGKALKGVPSREREDLVAYYDELIEDRLEQGKSTRRVFSELEAPEVVAENYLRERVQESDFNEKRGYHARNGNGFLRFLGGIFAVLFSIVLVLLIVLFALTALGLAAAGVYVFAISFGLLFDGHVALFFAQWGIAFGVFALGMFFEVVTVALAKGFGGMWRAVSGREKREKPVRKGAKRTLIAGCAVLLGGALMFTVSFGALGFDSKNLGVTEGLTVHEEVLEITDAVTLEVDNFTVTVKQSEDEKCTLVYRDFSDSPQTFFFTDGKAVLGGKSDGISVMGASVDLQWRYGLLIGVAAGELQRAELYLPASFSGELNVSVQNGVLSVSDMALKSISFSTTNGVISMKNIVSEAVSATTVNGAVTLQNITAASVGAETTNGAVKFNNVTAETVTAEVKTGAINLKDVACTRVHASTSTGKISLEDLRADSIFLHTSTGDVAGTVSGKEEEYSVTASVATGSCNLQNRTGGSKQLDVRVSTGSVNIKFVE